MTAEVLAATEHLVLRRMANDDAAALAAYRSDPVQARYQSWETPYPLGQRPGAHRPDAQRAIRPNPAYGSRSASRPADGSSATSRSASTATRPARPPSGSPSPLTRKATGTPPKHYAQSSHCCSPSTTYTASAPTATPATTARSHCSNVGTRREAHHHKSAWWKGEWTDEYVYAILAEEWPDKSHGTDPQPPAEAGGRDR
jgi:aminoglycoside 6'-N-acetyltransferase